MGWAKSKARDGRNAAHRRTNPAPQAKVHALRVIFSMRSAVLRPSPTLLSPKEAQSSAYPRRESAGPKYASSQMPAVNMDATFNIPTTWRLL